jgi:flagellar biosynthetic protein FliP
MIGIALFLTFFIMQPTLTTIYNEAVIPYEAGEIDQDEAIEKASEPIREFMYRQTQKKDVNLFMEINRTTWNGELEEIPMSVLVPSFIISELRTAFIIGFLIYIPFIVIDMVVASTLMSMGMMMLPPTTISMPFKILLFVLADGWYLIIKGLVESFYIY